MVDFSRGLNQMTTPGDYDARISQLESTVRELEQALIGLREDAVTINGSVGASTVQVNLRGTKRKISHTAP